MAVSPQEISEMLTLEGWVFLYLVVMSFICALMMMLDKFRAERDMWRIPEGKLLAWAFLGGALGGKLAQKLVRHKTRKQPFASYLNTWVFWNLVFYTIAFIPPLRDLTLQTLHALLIFASDMA